MVKSSVASRIPNQRSGEAPRAAGPVSVLVAGPITSVWAVITGLSPIAVMVVLVWAADSRSTVPAADAARFACSLWVFAHGAALSTSTGLIGLTPLAFTALVGWRIWRAAESTSKAAGTATSWGVVRVALAVGVSYGGIAFGIAQWAELDGVHIAWWRVLLLPGLGAVLLAGVAAAQQSGLLRRARRAAPPYLRHGLRAAVAITSALVAYGALLGAIALIVHFDRASDLVGASTPGIVGGVGLLIVCLAYVPTVALWGAAYATGIGFAIGAGTLVSPSKVQLGAVPGLPILAGMPSTGSQLALVIALLVPVGVAIWAGLGIQRRLAHTDSWRMFAALGIAVAATAAMSAGLMVAAGGPLGDGRLVAVGPSAWRVGVAMAGLVAVAAGGAAMTCHWLVPMVRAGWGWTRRAPVRRSDPAAVQPPDRPTHRDEGPEPSSESAASQPPPPGSPPEAESG